MVNSDVEFALPPCSVGSCCRATGLSPRGPSRPASASTSRSATRWGAGQDGGRGGGSWRRRLRSRGVHTRRDWYTRSGVGCPQAVRSVRHGKFMVRGTTMSSLSRYVLQSQLISDRVSAVGIAAASGVGVDGGRAGYAAALHRRGRCDHEWVHYHAASPSQPHNSTNRPAGYQHTGQLGLWSVADRFPAYAAFVQTESDVVERFASRYGPGCRPSRRSTTKLVRIRDPSCVRQRLCWLQLRLLSVCASGLAVLTPPPSPPPQGDPMPHRTSDQSACVQLHYCTITSPQPLRNVAGPALTATSSR